MCTFCNTQDREILFETKEFYLVKDAYPVSEGHLLIVSKQHKENFFEIDAKLMRLLPSMLTKAKQIIETNLKPDGYNIGINIGKDAGQTIFHLHIHLIPRYKDDVENPKGGIRNFKKSLVEY